MIKAIIFDIGGVIKKGTSEVRQARVADKLKVDIEKFVDFWKKYRDRMAKGLLKEEEFCRLVEKEFGVRGVLKLELEEHERSCKENINSELLDFLSVLKKKYRLALVSNVSNLQKVANFKAGLYKYFDPCILSCDVGLAKPDPEIYKLSPEKLKLRPEECLLIDDREKYLDIAKQLGFAVLHFENNEKFKKDLWALGVRA